MKRHLQNPPGVSVLAEILLHTDGAGSLSSRMLVMLQDKGRNRGGREVNLMLPSLSFNEKATGAAAFPATPAGWEHPGVMLAQDPHCPAQHCVAHGI